MSNPNEAKTSNASTSTFITALVLNGGIFAIEIFLFTILRPRFKAIYEPRTYVPDEPKRIRPMGGMFQWPMTLMRLDTEDIKRTNGLDAYVFVRFLRMMVIIFFPLWIFSWILFLPLHAIGKTNSQKGLDMFTFGNVAKTQQARYAAHVVFLYIMTGWIFWNIKREMANFIRQRQRHLIDPEHSRTSQANTVLITGVPRKYLDEGVLAQLFSHLPGGAKAIWLNRNLKDMPDVYDRRMKACNKLEGAEKDLIKTAVKLHAKGKSPVGKGKTDSNTSLEEQLVPRNKRPMHRLSILGFLPFGKKVDSIDWAKNEIVECNRILDESRAVLQKDINTPGVGENETYPPLNSAFILFNQQIAAHLAATSLIHNEPYRMSSKYVEVAPEDVIWGNLGLNPYEMKIRKAISWAITLALILFWAIPVAIVGIIGNVVGLSQRYSWLAWLGKLPKPVMGIIQGILPPVLLAVLTMLLPIILRLLAKFEGVPRKTGVELSLMTRFFIFQVIHSFLIVTISGGIIAALPQIAANPGNLPANLAQKLPSAATFFITFILLQGLSGVGGGFLQAVPLLVYYVKLIILGSSPRKIYNIKFTLRNVAWGTLFPAITLLCVIALVYTPLQPIVTAVATGAFFLFYVLYKYLFLFVYDQPRHGDTGGLFFPKAIQHIFVGLYVQQICLAALFFLAQNENKKQSALPQGALMIVLLILTIGFNLIIVNSYGPLLHSLPLTLAHKSYGMPAEPNQPAQIGEDGEEDNNGQRNGQYPQDTNGQNQSNNHRLYDQNNTNSGQYGQTNTKGQYDHDYEMNGAAPTNASPNKQSQIAPSHVAFNHGGKTERAIRGGALDDDEDDERPIEQKLKEVPTDFNHPASCEPQRPIWMPRDPLGLADQEVQALNAEGITASTENADMNAKGKILIDGHPPEL